MKRFSAFLVCLYALTCLFSILHLYFEGAYPPLQDNWQIVLWPIVTFLSITLFGAVWLVPSIIPALLIWVIGLKLTTATKINSWYFWAAVTALGGAGMAYLNFTIWASVNALTADTEQVVSGAGHVQIVIVIMAVLGGFVGYFYWRETEKPKLEAGRKGATTNQPDSKADTQ